MTNEEVKACSLFDIDCNELNNCCFCGKKGASHDIRPLATNRGNKCCDECNRDIVCVSRVKIWEKENYD